MGGNCHLWVIPEDMGVGDFRHKFDRPMVMLADIGDLRIELGYAGGLSVLPPRKVWSLLTKMHMILMEAPSRIDDMLIADFREAYTQEFDSNYADEWRDNEAAVIAWLERHKGLRIIAEYDG